MVRANPTIFVSYSHREEERKWVREFVDSLVAQGAKVWYDESEIRIGDRIVDALDEGLRSSDVIAWLGDASSMKQPWVLFEIGAAVGMKKWIIPIVPADLDPADLPYPLRIRKMLVRSSPEETARRLVLQTTGAEVKEESEMPSKDDTRHS